MIESPNIAIIQHTSGVLRVVHNLFETESKSYGAKIEALVTNKQ
jgi:hypothetical protein